MTRSSHVSLLSALFLLPLAVVLLPLSAEAKLPAGTGITASKTAAGHLTSTSIWTIAKSADPASQTVSVGKSATVHWMITTTKSASGTIGAYLDGQVCVTNTGTRATQGLTIRDQVMKPPSTTVLNTAAVDVSAKPLLNPGETYCYPYTITVPAASIVPGAIYKDTANVTITNQSCCPGTPTGPSPSATVTLPTTPTPIDSSITVTDTNGQSFNFTSGSSQGYDQTFDCPSDPGDHTLHNVATIQSTGQTASADATVRCLIFPQSNPVAQPLCHELNAFGTCVSIFLDTTEAECGGCLATCCPDDCCNEENHHQGLARTSQLHDDSVYFFLSHSGVNDVNDRGKLFQFRYAGGIDGEHVTSQGDVASLKQRLVLVDEQHPSAITFLPDVNRSDSGYLFVTKEYDAQKVTIYYWEPDADFAPIGSLFTGDVTANGVPLAKPSHVLIDKVSDYYYLVILDNTNKVGQPYRAYYSALFPSGDKGSMQMSAFETLPPFQFSGNLGSQAQLVRDSTATWYVVVYDSPDDTGFGDDFVHVFNITFDEVHNVVSLGGEVSWSPIQFFLPEGGTSFTNTGTHFVNLSGRMLISSSDRWAQSEGDPAGYASRVDECVAGAYDAGTCAGQVCGAGENSCGERIASCGTCPASRPKCCLNVCVCDTCECP